MWRCFPQLSELLTPPGLWGFASPRRRFSPALLYLLPYGRIGFSRLPLDFPFEGMINFPFSIYLGEATRVDILVGFGTDAVDRLLCLYRAMGYPSWANKIGVARAGDTTSLTPLIKTGFAGSSLLSFH